MKKLLLTILMAGAVFAAFGAAHLTTHTSGGYYFMFDATETVYVLGSTAGIAAFGYYYIDNPTVLIAGNMATGTVGNFQAGDTIGIWIQNFPDLNNGREIQNIYTSSNTGNSTYLLANLTTLSIDAYLATIDIWQYPDNSGGKSGNPLQNLGSKSFQFGISRQNIWIEGEDDDDEPNGAPLPGVLMALVIGGGFAFGRKYLKNKVKK